MKRILMIFITAILFFAIIGCTAPPEPWEQMDELTNPELIEDVRKSDSLGDTLFPIDLYVTHSLSMNENETLYYAPLSIRNSGQIWLNDDLKEPADFICNNDDDFCTVISDDFLKEIFKE